MVRSTIGLTVSKLYMTVKELIEQLNKFESNSAVFFKDDYDRHFPVNSIMWYGDEVGRWYVLLNNSVAENE